MSRKIYIIGVGLIGGSFALEIKKIFPDSNIIGIDNSKENLDQAINLGIIDAIGSIWWKKTDGNSRFKWRRRQKTTLRTSSPATAQYTSRVATHNAP